MTYQPLGTNIIIDPIAEDDVKQVGKIFTVSLAPKSGDLKTGKVLAVGTGYEFTNGTRRDLLVKVNDIVCYQPGGNYTLDLDGKSVIVIREHDVCCIKTEER